VDYRPKTKAAISWDTSHNNGRPRIGGIRQGKETKNLNVFDVLAHCIGVNKIILNWPRPPKEGTRK
jgi:hypothetical protein